MLPSSTPNVQRPTKPPGTVGPTTMPSPKVAHSALTVGTNPFPISDESQRKLKQPQNGNVHSSQNKAIPEIKLTGFVGFDSLPYQLVRKCQENGFQFNLLCVGETGMGKTTLLESLFNMKMEFEQCNRELKTVELREKTFDVQEGAVKVKLRVVETAGFGDQLDKEKSAQIIVNYINDQFEAYLKEELKVKRNLSSYEDRRIHACLYFISPTGHGIKALDLITLRELAKRVNVIPVIAKSDTTCKDELQRFKQKVVSELKAQHIEIYQFPTEDETVRKDNTELNALVPFAVVGSTDFITKEDGRVLRARRYPWGVVEVENEEHCDFVKLREAMLRINEDSLRDRTHTVLYERYRRERLKQMKIGDGDAGPKMMEAFVQRRKELEDEFLKRKDQYSKEMQQRVSKKEAELKHHEEILNIRHTEIDNTYQNELKLVEAQINGLIEEKAKLEIKLKKQQRSK
ncbi:hypothetical protein niasHS_010232 [Heterodera schachtii]|uniref:Septin n=1 Tax=Heterodera schachtii TaxID=97005 RepID=A0ABD2J636_HETSC